MNVLVYSGSDVHQTSFTGSTATLRSLLAPNYAVQSVPLQSLAAHPWCATCALLVFPACRIPLMLSSTAMHAVRLYVEGGGSLLAFGATSSLQKQRNAASRLDNMMQDLGVADDHSLQFVDDVSGTSVNLRFSVRSDDAACTTGIKLLDGTRVDGLLSPGDPGPSDIADGADVEALAVYTDGASRTGLAGASCCINKGRAAFWDLFIEYPLREEPASSILQGSTPTLSQEQINAAERQRRSLMRLTLERLGLRLPTQASIPSAFPLPQVLTAQPSRLDIVPKILAGLSIGNISSSPYVLSDSSDVFHFHDSFRSETVLKVARASAAAADHDASTSKPKHIIAYMDGTLPALSDTPYFNIRKYYDALTAARSKAGLPHDAEIWGMGDAFLYGEVITSTQTLLDKNRSLLSSLPTPLLSLATFQLAGRGRGTNIWISSSECLQFSLLLRVSLSALPAVRLVFVQYLFGLAVVEACRDAEILGAHGESVRLKWPNDIYVVVGGEKKKIGGILVHTSFSDGNVEIVIGCGLNVLNPPPMASLSQLAPAGSDAQLSLERTVGIIMAQFEKMWGTFLSDRGSFEAFMDLYLERWLHSDQLVTLTTVKPPMKVRVVSITSDHGMLRTMPERDVWSGGGRPQYVDLQPDGNSFDMMAGLIKTKS